MSVTVVKLLEYKKSRQRRLESKQQQQQQKKTNQNKKKPFTFGEDLFIQTIAKIIYLDH